MIVIYCATNKINGKKYVGKASRWPHRKNQHHSDAMNGSDLAFHRAIRKYGFDNFEWTILDACDNQDNACVLEIKYIEEQKSYSNGYNMTKGGEKTSFPPDYWKGRKQSADHVEKRISKLRGKNLPEETRQKISESRQGIVPWNKGKPNPTGASNGKLGAEKQSKRVTGRKRKYLPNGKWTWEYPND